MAKIYEHLGKSYTRTATGGCIGCIFGSNRGGQCINGNAPRFARNIECIGDEGPAFEEHLKPTTTPTTKETKMTQTTKTHGKPTAKGLRAPKKAVEAKKPEYPAPRVQIAALKPVKPLDKMTKVELIEAYGVLKEQFDNQAADHCIAGTKLDRTLVDLKEAKAKIKELSK